MITKKLLEQGICFAVVQSNSYLTKAKMMMNQEWEIIASEKDRKSLQGLSFTKNEGHHVPVNHRNPEGVISHSLNLMEIREFKTLIPEHFTKVVENENGTVWEIKGNSFKQHLKGTKNGRLRNVS